MVFAASVDKIILILKGAWSGRFAKRPVVVSPDPRGPKALGWGGDHIKLYTVRLKGVLHGHCFPEDLTREDD